MPRRSSGPVSAECNSKGFILDEAVTRNGLALGGRKHLAKLAMTLPVSAVRPRGTAEEKIPYC